MGMPSALSQNDLLSAYRILFGRSIPSTDDFIIHIEPSTLKLAYRKRALETHPDRCRILGKSESEMSELFREVSNAYEKLKTFADQNREAPQFFRPKTKARRKTERPSPSPFDRTFRDSYFTGDIPHRYLKLGQFLYYSGLISWKSMIRAILWQKRQRPLFGQIALEWGFLTLEEIRYILSVKPYDEPFGEYAKRTGLLTHFQQLAVLGKQRMRQPLIGRYFSEMGLLPEQQIIEMVQRLATHNQNIKFRPSDFQSTIFR